MTGGQGEKVFKPSKKWGIVEGPWGGGLSVPREFNRCSLTEMIDCFLLTTDCVVGWMLSLANSYAPQNLSTCKKESTKPAKWGWIDREIS